MYVAVDGSPLIEQPNSLISLHLIEWLSALHGAGAGVTLIYPKGELPPIPTEIRTQAIVPKEGVWSRLRFEQRDLPKAAGELDADLLLVGEGRAPLASPCPIATVSSFSRDSRSKGLAEKLAFAAGSAGSRGAVAKLYPGDVRSQSGHTRYAPFVTQAFAEASAEIGEEYVLCYGFSQKDISLILSAWTWVDGSMGDTVPLTFLGASASLTAEIHSVASELDIEASVRTQSEVTYDDLPKLYEGAAAYLGTGFEADGQALRWALASGTPVVGLKTPDFESVLAGAAYLVPPGNSRSLGAACLTVLIQDRVSEPLREKGLQRAKGYLDDRVLVPLVELLTEISRSGKGAPENGN
jgi:glycosyltransferase involved in cell wall biosynthesis